MLFLRRSSVGHLIYMCLVCSIWTVYTMDLFNVKVVELDDSRLIATSNYNYAISSPRLSSRNWRAVSVNGDSVFIITTDGLKIDESRSTLARSDREFLENLRDDIANSNRGFNHFSSSSGGAGPFGGGGGSMMMSSNSGGGGFSRSFSTSSGGSFSSMTSGGGSTGNFQMNDLSINVRDENNFSVSKSDLPYGWSQVFFSDGGLATVVARDGTVLMSPINLMEPDQADAVRNLRSQVKEMQRNQARQLANGMQQSMDMVSNVFSNVMGSLPRPPSYQSAVGNMFGNSFPFGQANNPFSNFPGMFGGGGAMAFASARR